MWMQTLRSSERIAIVTARIDNRGFGVAHRIAHKLSAKDTHKHTRMERMERADDAEFCYLHFCGVFLALVMDRSKNTRNGSQNSVVP